MKSIIATATAVMLSTVAYAEEYPLRYDLPLDCANGPTCYLQNLVDMDDSSARLDPFCTRSTFNGHKGTDIRVATFEEMNRGVAVLAMADGVVGGSRNGMDDVLIETIEQRQAVKGKECGNGLILSHGIFDGREWTTQYCHMRKGSVLVKKGDKVKRGQNLGLIGLSGMTQFPHIHVSTRIGKDHYDPLTGRRKGDTSCNAKAVKPLFTPAALEQLKATNGPLILAGFSAEPVNNKTSMKGRPAKPAIGTPLIYYAYMKNLLKGDRIKLTITTDGKPYVSNTTKPLNVDKATYTSYAGKRSGAKRGTTYAGKVEVLRAEKVVFESAETKIRF